MIQAFFGGAASLRSRQTAMDVIANDIANVNTAGYVQRDTDFSDLLYDSMVRPENPSYANELEGSGAGVDAVVADASAGSFVQTGSLLNFAPRGEGFFAVRDAQGVVSYTRDGTFTAQPENGAAVLVDAQGRTVLDAQGNAIAVQNGVPQTQPGVFAFAFPQNLTALGGSLFAASASSGAAQVSDEGVLQGAYETSNVDLSSEMGNMIVTQRGFQMNARVVSTADQIESYVNDLH
ncbi:flagellar hook-basal body protein [Ethanoligenens harbinense]|uniref:Flagellar hook-basal body protein n=1 Tax=Ethanoligenens harbinense (strain DSM 18485 / JCM 12961 / CGMCC 1.5033 / YUAN-3) TaxID=663278 RepID=E6U6H9_ETHHY|nr:flagellar hook-basal body protein [Ethanoligenens harbinense]ADU28049.1 flagellar hook-basal body protein [Ethanoligenens harbinense YUAN-3]AVQ97066.1 flagellar hook-basal body protein [Ethanoligenens harbinense YUAN-3]AYF39728.1 flagellar hook-basal body protein [Ethanoligenens harbinense]AYF42561.1 flagellar hook-basal body protein [Ethanoligenens harbinense]QCN93309.1 flagellar hook-basal body protein [Ethanoligenens harbinense]